MQGSDKASIMQGSISETMQEASKYIEIIFRSYALEA